MRKSPAEARLHGVDAALFFHLFNSPCEILKAIEVTLKIAFAALTGFQEIKESTIYSDAGRVGRHGVNIAIMSISASSEEVVGASVLSLTYLSCRYLSF